MLPLFHTQKIAHWRQHFLPLPAKYLISLLSQPVLSALFLFSPFVSSNILTFTPLASQGWGKDSGRGKSVLYCSFFLSILLLLHTNLSLSSHLSVREKSVVNFMVTDSSRVISTNLSPGNAVYSKFSWTIFLSHSKSVSWGESWNRPKRRCHAWQLSWQQTYVITVFLHHWAHIEKPSL